MEDLNNNESKETETKKEPEFTDIKPESEKTPDKDADQKARKKKQDPEKKLFIILLSITVAITAIILGIYFGYNHVSGKTNTTSTTNADSAQAEIKINSTKDENALSATEIATKVRPSVVGVIIYVNGTEYTEGSGVFMSEDDDYTYVLTCAHMVEYSNCTAKIQMEDTTQYDAEIVGYDSTTDIAVLRVKQHGFTIAEFGDSSKLEIGDTVYAIGNPGGTTYYGSFTAGVVSAIYTQSQTSEGGYSRECIQHDAAINPGNSGGALVNEYGQVVGINSSKIVNEQYEGMGFAIPISVAKETADDILANGTVTNSAKLGITYTTSSYSETYAYIIKNNSLPAGSIIITAIDSDSGLKATEAQAGDIIIAVNGKELTSSSTLFNVVQSSKVGDVIELTMCHVNNDYSIEKYKAKVKLVEAGSSSTTTTTEEYYNPFK